MSGPAAVHPLHGNQMRAVDPRETVWLSASAGTGKTQVLSSRVLRLLLQPGVEPSQILCLTFTKAGAAEMATRINGTLAEWVRLPDIELFGRLRAIGAPDDPDTRARARTLFAAVLDCPGGGLRIDTIHAFSQWLLGAFPEEAGLMPGTRPMEDRERVLLAREVLGELLVRAEADPVNGPDLLAAVADLSIRSGAAAVEAYLLRCAGAQAAWFGPGSWQEPMRPNVLRLLGLPAGADARLVASLCADDSFDVQSLRRCMEINAQWSAATGQNAANAIGAWLVQDAAGRADGLAGLAEVFLTRDGKPRASKSQAKIDPFYDDYVARVCDAITRAREAQALLALADRLVPALRLGRAFALAWDEAKSREGLIDFDDQIRAAADLLGRKPLAEWIRYKLDRRFDHILVDEAQDTNASQWDIIFAMAEEFWAGLGQHDDRMRTLFVVGDYKQAIFRFQGTSPENFRRAAAKVRALMQAASDNAAQMRSNLRVRELRELGLERSFRTAKNVLEFVDEAIADIGSAQFGLDETPEPHEGQERPGYVSLWQPVDEERRDAEEDEDNGEGDEGWLSKPERRLAEKIAQQVKEWLDPAGPGFYLHKSGRRAGPGDIMVLVRKRRELAGLIVGRLHAAGVEVAGVDRLRLGAPLAVKDLVAALRFAVQPHDDLTLASLLVSPLMGWSQEQLLEHGYRGRGISLWDHLRRTGHPDVDHVRERLGALLRLADFDPPQILLQWLLVGPWQARKRLVARLGVEANDPIDELLNAAHAYTATGTPSLAGFLAWFDAGDGELKREADSAAGLVRVMTVHGSKGLQAPIVILADATGNPELSRESSIALADPPNPERRIPLPPLRKEERVGPVPLEAEAVRREEEQEHWRLLYVAMTRAEEALYVGGALGRKDKGAPSEKSWYARLSGLFTADQALADPIWGYRLDWGHPPEAETNTIAPAKSPELPLPEPLPRWLEAASPVEPRPPRPLAPSSLGEDDASDPPYPPGSGAEAARRGTIIHRLLERLPEIPAESREDAARAWLARQAADFDESARDAMLAATLAVVNHADWQQLFAPGSLAEVPVAAVVGGQVVAGTVDRLIVTPEAVRIVDYKTARRPPSGIEQVPRSTLRQMAAYVAALELTFPGRRVEAAILYTAAPRLIVLSADAVEANKPAFDALQ